MSATVKKRIRRIGMFVITGTLITFCALLVMRAYFPLPYKETVERHALAHQLDPLLIASIMRVESGFDPRAISVKGARGLMQLMPETAQWVAEQMGMDAFGLEMLFEPEVNVRMGAWYLSDLRRLFEGETVLALAAYNGGRGNVLRWLNEQAWSGAIEEISDIPFPETREYVRRVLSTYTIYRRIWGPVIGSELAL